MWKKPSVAFVFAWVKRPRRVVDLFRQDQLTIETYGDVPQKQIFGFARYE